MFWLFRWVLRILVGLLAIVVLYFAVTAVQVWLTSRKYEPHKADTIVVMGAAQYDGTPSPDLAARLDEAITLYHEGWAPLIVVTGYKEKGDLYTEAQAGSAYLQQHGIPASAIVEASGSDSYQNLTDAAAALQGRGVHTILISTDPFHEDRSMAIASSLGFVPYPTPTRSSPIGAFASIPYFAKETVAVGLGRIVGYANLNRLHSFG